METAAGQSLTELFITRPAEAWPQRLQQKVQRKLYFPVAEAVLLEEAVPQEEAIPRAEAIPQGMKIVVAIPRGMKITEAVPAGMRAILTKKTAARKVRMFLLMQKRQSL